MDMDQSATVAVIKGPCVVKTKTHLVRGGREESQELIQSSCSDVSTMSHTRSDRIGRLSVSAKRGYQSTRSHSEGLDAEVNSLWSISQAVSLPVAMRRK